MSNLLALLKELIPVVFIAAIVCVGNFLIEVSEGVFFSAVIENPTPRVLLVALAVALAGYLIYVLGARLWNK
ncbi:MAG: hypothetical protein HY273_02875 [Gammaproteobacteria bacterium]|nr:hypothetical protein [Gammaproteobacteria bacterium]